MSHSREISVDLVCYVDFVLQMYKSFTDVQKNLRKYLPI